jgi:ABC-type phosphate transport system permease subunit
MIGETAPLLFTALNNQVLQTDMASRWPTCRS